MGKMKELLFEIQEERTDEWIAENYPDAEEGTPEWDAAAQEYSWFQDWMEEAAEQQYFEASLASIPDRLQDANAASITVCGKRCRDMQLRLKYVDIPSDVEQDIEKAIENMLYQVYSIGN